MDIEQFHISGGKDTNSGEITPGLGDADLVFAFGGTSVLDNKENFQLLRKLYPTAVITGCSTAGEICGTQFMMKRLQLLRYALKIQ